jgi:peptidoglycan/xylan/chitin deacetylase (PgdA/CDA1 family)
MLLKNYLFHRVSDETDPQWQPMRLVLFEKIISQLTRQGNVILLEDFLANPLSFGTTTKNFTTISFDDGYKDNIEYAAPILKKYNCPASFYIVTGCIDTNTPTWTYLIDHFLANTSKKRIGFPFDFVPAEMKSIQLRHKSSTKQDFGKIKPWLKTLSNQQQTIIIKSLIQQCNDVELPMGQMMSWNDIRQLKSSGFHIGSHSHTHTMLATLESEAEIKNELTVSYKRISDELGNPPLTISYPVGSFDDRVIRMSVESGYKFGLAVEQKFFHFNSAGVFSIPRMELYEEPWWKAQLRMKGIISSVKRIWK